MDEDVSFFYNNVMENVRSIRKEKNIAQLDLAYAIGHKTVSTISKIESGLENKHYNLEHLYKIAKVLEVDICELLKNK